MKRGLLRAGFVFLIGSISTSVLNYLYHLFMGRMLGPEEYGVLGSLFALMYITQFASSTIYTTISKFISKLKGKNSYNKIRFLVEKIRCE